ncbi:MAG TPA: BatA domain-containing protein [Pirellulales bacterium]|nr:BatA domain-containing protein [Pirellulales bacterium]
MSFIQIGFLSALLALAIPIIIHLVFRQRTRPADLGTLRFLRVVLERNARRRRVMRWFLLALRMACIALLAVLFARPYLRAFQVSGEKETVVVLIDRSATMELQQDGARLVDRAVAETRDLLNQATENSRFEIAFFDHAVHPVGAEAEPAKERDAPAAAKPAADASATSVAPKELASLLAAPPACYGGTDYGAAMDWARDVLAKAPPGPRKLHIFTDLQRSGLAWSEVDSLQDDVVTSLHDLGRSAVNNIAVVEARPERVWVRPNDQTAVHATVHNGGPFGTEELSVVLRLAADERKLELRERVKIDPGASESVRFDLPPLAAGAWKGRVLIEAEDDLPVDNERYVEILAASPYQVLLVDGRAASSPRLAATYFLEAALRLAPSGQSDPASFDPTHSFEPTLAAVDSLPAKLERFDVVLLADPGQIESRDVKRLDLFVQGGGKLLVFGGENVTADRTANLKQAGLTPGEIVGVHAATDLPLRLQSWDVRHPIFAAFSDPQLGDLRRLSFSACTNIVPAADAEVLAAFRDGKPALIERRHKKGSILWFTSSGDREWSDWPRSRLYLPLVYQLIGYQTGLAAGGRVRPVVLEGKVDLPGDMAPGIVAGDGYSSVVNTSPRESETERCPAEEFVNRFGLKLADAEQAPAPASPVHASLGTEMIESELWQWVALALLTAFVIESLVANRTTA